MVLVKNGLMNPFFVSGNNIWFLAHEDWKKKKATVKDQEKEFNDLILENWEQKKYTRGEFPEEFIEYEFVQGEESLIRGNKIDFLKIFLANINIPSEKELWGVNALLKAYDMGYPETLKIDWNKKVKLASYPWIDEFMESCPDKYIFKPSDVENSFVRLIREGFRFLVGYFSSRRLLDDFINILMYTSDESVLHPIKVMFKGKDNELIKPYITYPIFNPAPTIYDEFKTQSQIEEFTIHFVINPARISNENLSNSIDEILDTLKNTFGEKNVEIEEIPAKNRNFKLKVKSEMLFEDFASNAKKIRDVIFKKVDKNRKEKKGLSPFINKKGQLYQRIRLHDFQMNVIINPPITSIAPVLTHNLLTLIKKQMLAKFNAVFPEMNLSRMSIKKVFRGENKGSIKLGVFIYIPWTSRYYLEDLKNEYVSLEKSDRWTELAAVYLRKGNIKEGEMKLKEAKKCLLADLYVFKSENEKGKRKKALLLKAEQLYAKLGLTTGIKPYLGSSLDETEVAINENRKWFEKWYDLNGELQPPKIQIVRKIVRARKEIPTIRDWKRRNLIFEEVLELERLVGIHFPKGLSSLRADMMSLENFLMKNLINMLYPHYSR